MSSQEPITERRSLKSLKPFPDQHWMFDSLSDTDLAGLARDIQRNGLKTPIEVLPRNRAGLPAGTILRGHQRLRALRLNGETEADVLVRYDLADGSRDQIEREFLEDNLFRRQLDPLAKAKVALRLAEIERQAAPGEVPEGEGGEVRDRVGKAIGMSGRNLDRYLSVLKAPVACLDIADDYGLMDPELVRLLWDRVPRAVTALSALRPR